MFGAYNLSRIVTIRGSVLARTKLTYTPARIPIKKNILIENDVSKPIFAYTMSLRKGEPRCFLNFALSNFPELRKVVNKDFNEFVQSNADVMLKGYPVPGHFYNMAASAKLGEKILNPLRLQFNAARQKQIKEIGRIILEYLDCTPGGGSRPVSEAELISHNILKKNPETGILEPYQGRGRSSFRNIPLTPDVGVTGYWVLLNGDLVEYEVLGAEAEVINGQEYEVFSVLARTIKGLHTLNGELIHRIAIPKNNTGNVLFLYTGAGASWSPMYGLQAPGLMDQVNYDVALMWLATVKNWQFFQIYKDKIRQILETQPKWKMPEHWLEVEKVKKLMDNWLPGLSLVNAYYSQVTGFGFERGKHAFGIAVQGINPHQSIENWNPLELEKIFNAEMSNINKIS